MTNPDDETRLQQRPDLVPEIPERLLRGGLIVGAEQGISGPLMQITGIAAQIP